MLGLRSSSQSRPPCPAHPHAPLYHTGISSAFAAAGAEVSDVPMPDVNNTVHYPASPFSFDCPFLVDAKDSPYCTHQGPHCERQEDKFVRSHRQWWRQGRQARHEHQKDENQDHFSAATYAPYSPVSASCSASLSAPHTMASAMPWYRRLPPPGCDRLGTLHPGAVYEGTQKNGTKTYAVRVELITVDLFASKCVGYLLIKGLTAQWPEMTTCFDGELVDPDVDALMGETIPSHGRGTATVPSTSAAHAASSASRDRHFLAMSSLHRAYDQQAGVQTGSSARYSPTSSHVGGGVPHNSSSRLGAFTRDRIDREIRQESGYEQEQRPKYGQQGPYYGLVTGKWEASIKDDREHWSRFGPVKRLIGQRRSAHLASPGNDAPGVASPGVSSTLAGNRSAEPAKGPTGRADRSSRGFVLMRWKERFLVPDHRVPERDIQGASYAGFYYVCVEFGPSRGPNMIRLPKHARPTERTDGSAPGERVGTAPSARESPRRLTRTRTAVPLRDPTGVLTRSLARRSPGEHLAESHSRQHSVMPLAVVHSDRASNSIDSDTLVSPSSALLPTRAGHNLLGLPRDLNPQSGPAVPPPAALRPTLPDSNLRPQGSSQPSDGQPMPTTESHEDLLQGLNQANRDALQSYLINRLLREGPSLSSRDATHILRAPAQAPSYLWDPTSWADRRERPEQRAQRDGDRSEETRGDQVAEGGRTDPVSRGQHAHDGTHRSSLGPVHPTSEMGMRAQDAGLLASPARIQDDSTDDPYTTSTFSRRDPLRSITATTAMHNSNRLSTGSESTRSSTRPPLAAVEWTVSRSSEADPPQLSAEVMTPSDFRLSLRTPRTLADAAAAAGRTRSPSAMPATSLPAALPTPDHSSSGGGGRTAVAEGGAAGGPFLQLPRSPAALGVSEQAGSSSAGGLQSRDSTGGNVLFPPVQLGGEERDLNAQGSASVGTAALGTATAARSSPNNHPSSSSAPQSSIQEGLLHSHLPTDSPAPMEEEERDPYERQREEGQGPWADRRHMRMARRERERFGQGYHHGYHVRAGAAPSFPPVHDQFQMEQDQDLAMSSGQEPFGRQDLDEEEAKGLEDADVASIPPLGQGLAGHMTGFYFHRHTDTDPDQQLSLVYCPARSQGCFTLQ